MSGADSGQAGAALLFNIRGGSSFVTAAMPRSDGLPICRHPHGGWLMGSMAVLQSSRQYP